MTKGKITIKPRNNSAIAQIDGKSIDCVKSIIGNGTHMKIKGKNVVVSPYLSKDERNKHIEDIINNNRFKKQRNVHQKFNDEEFKDIESCEKTTEHIIGINNSQNAEHKGVSVQKQQRKKRKNKKNKNIQKRYSETYINTYGDRFFPGWFFPGRGRGGRRRGYRGRGGRGGRHGRGKRFTYKKKKKNEKPVVSNVNNIGISEEELEKREKISCIEETMEKMALELKKLKEM